MNERAAIILAAGKGTRMNSDLPKVLHEVAGQPMLGHVLTACREAGVGRMYVVVGHGAELVQKLFADASDVVWVVQAEQRGTGHAVLCCQEYLQDFDGQTLILCGDGPLIRSETLVTLLTAHADDDAAATLATALLEDPTGYGRIVRDEEDRVVAIVEHNDCSPEQLAIREVNPSYYCFDNQELFAAVIEIKPNNAKNELYLTDAVSILIARGKKITSVAAVQPEEALSINSVEQLAEIDRIMVARTQKENA